MFIAIAIYVAPRTLSLFQLSNGAGPALKIFALSKSQIRDVVVILFDSLLDRPASAETHRWRWCTSPSRQSLNEMKSCPLLNIIVGKQVVLRQGGGTIYPPGVR